MKRLIITLSLVLIAFIFALLSSKSDVIGYPVNNYYAFGSAIGKMISAYLLGMLGIFLINKIEGGTQVKETKDQKRLIIAILILFVTFMYKFSFTSEAKNTCYTALEEAVVETENKCYEEVGKNLSEICQCK